MNTTQSPLSNFITFDRLLQQVMLISFLDMIEMITGELKNKIDSLWDIFAAVIAGEFHGSYGAAVFVI